MDYKEVMENAKKCIGPYCKVCPVCNGAACKNSIPGPGAKGTGDVAIRNYKKWQEIRVCMDTLCEQKDVQTGMEMFGKSFAYPFFAAPVGSVNLHYGKEYTDQEYDRIVVEGCAKSGIAAFVGDGPHPDMMIGGVNAVRQANGIGIPTVKPWDMQTISEKMKLVKECGAFAVAMDIDAAGLPFLQNQNPPAGSKSVEQLKEIVQMTDLPFILKGIMTPKAALKAIDAGVDAIVVSNHGGRVLDQCMSTAEVLPSIVEAVEGRIKIFVDGGIRSGVDIFKALALGADAVMLARPFVTAVYGGEIEGVESLVSKLGNELVDTMKMCGAYSLRDVKGDMVQY
ncbi:MAG: alpha-hydroxy-acid oxidizing protein, partial [Clostridia bacterium]|nr:alpha-hydroxy-acid oxidizing protein [Clostridia bacterium]